MFRRDGQANSAMRLQSGRGLSNSNIFLDCHYRIILYSVYIYTHNVRGEKNKQIYNTFTQSEEALVAFHYRAMHRPSTTTNATNAQNTQPVMFMTLEKFRACLNQTADTDCIH